MTTKRQKELGLDTFEIEASKGHIKLLMQFLEVNAKCKNMTTRAVFEGLTEKITVDAYGPEHAMRKFRLHLSQYKDFD